jgi:hypothetical protein
MAAMSAKLQWASGTGKRSHTQYLCIHEATTAIYRSTDGVEPFGSMVRRDR